MRAAVVTSLAAPLEIQDRPVRDPGAGRVCVRAEVLCHAVVLGA